MFGIFGKKRLKESHVAKVFVKAINETTVDGYHTIIEFIKEDSHFKTHPSFGPQHFEWFLFITFCTNLKNLKNYFDGDQLFSLRTAIIDEFVKSVEDKSEEEIIELINNYEYFLSTLKVEQDKYAKMIARALFLKFNLTEHQIDHFAQVNEPNPLVMKDLIELTQFFIWNWEDFLEKYKVTS